MLTIEGKPSEVKNLVRQSLLLLLLAYLTALMQVFELFMADQSVQLSDFKVTMQQDSTVEHQHVGTFSHWHN